jgi:hypothetical protein
MSLQINSSSMDNWHAAFQLHGTKAQQELVSSAGYSQASWAINAPADPLNDLMLSVREK